ncbi:hypothetical protein H5410_005343 [Solanum commersonii]|uniref:Uncharacterized protein n=1 Tax=Solanum commersonii TaxID=4109 RepID=A0A9J6A6D3_SOLCO|nr:hypothetical protein H5410_005343 [Solanum commersonii]
MIPDTAIQDLLVAELPRYKMVDGLFGCGPAKRARDNAIGVATAIGVNESIYHLRGLSSRSRALDKGKGVETTSTSSTSSRTRTLIDEDYQEEEDEEQYNVVEDVDLQELDSFEEE